jgi:hypothetical protein
LSVLEPRGLIRLLQLIFAIFAFATACSGGSSLTAYDNSNNVVASVSWSYPYSLQDATINTNLNTTQDTLTTSNDIQPSAQFFVFTGVTSMLLSLAFIILYVLMDLRYRNDDRFPTIDFVIALIWTIFWIAASSAWAQGVSNIRTQTSFDYVSTLIAGCTNSTICATYDCELFAIIFFLNIYLYYSCHLCQYNSLSDLWFFEFFTLAWLYLVYL